MRVIAITSLLALAACGGGGGGSDASPDGLSARAQALAFGTKSGAAPGNGLGFATDTSVTEDANGAGPINVKLVGAFTDHETGETRLIISDETVTTTDLDNGELVITLNGDTLAFIGGGGPESVVGGQPWSTSSFTSGDVSATQSIFVYERAENPDLTGEFDAEFLYVVGLETDPTEIEAHTGTVAYIGQLSGFGQLLDLDGNLIQSEVIIDGDIEITAAFDDLNTVNGALNASYSIDDGDITNEVEMTFGAGIDGNGYAADLNCTSGCTGNASVLAGAFYGQDALETSGLIGFDITSSVTDPDNPDAPLGTQFIGGAGFTATQDGGDNGGEP